MKIIGEWYCLGMPLINEEIKQGFTPLEIMDRCFTAGLHFKMIPAGFNVLLEFLTGFIL
jgi:hypothetical protein